MLKVNVEAVSKCDSLACCEVWLDVVLINISLLLIRCKNHNDVCLLSCFCCCINLEAKLLNMIPTAAALIKTNDYIDATISEVKSVSVTL